MMHRRRLLLGLGGGALLASCASPSVELYTLVAVPGAPHRARVREVELRRIGLAGYLDRPEIVRSAGTRIHVTDRERWGEPLGGMIGRVFTEDLVQRLPGTAVYSDTGAITARPDLVLEIDIQRFDTDPSGTVVLLAQTAMRHDSGEPVAVADTLRITLATGSPDTASLVAAMSAALGELADRVAERVAR
jgi:uncharacterized lipoprotein YmbA